MRLALGVTLNYHTSVAKDLKLKNRKFWGISPTFVEVTHYEAPADLKVEITKDKIIPPLS